MRTPVGLGLLPLAAAVGQSTYDYVVVGGGTSGLVIANRLSEDPTVSVLVIEAGPSVYNVTDVTDPNGYGLLFGSEYDWQYKTTPQIYGNGSAMTIRAAKALGGTSVMNGMAYTRAETAQIDAWEKLGMSGWTWDALFPYYLKSEGFQTPSAARVAASHLAWNSSAHNTTGPLHTGWIYGMTNSTVPVVLNATYQSLGLSWNQDVNDGAMVGHGLLPSTVDTAENVRHDAARAYYYPVSPSRSNLKVLLNTTANKLTWCTENGHAGLPTANGVHVTFANGSSTVIGFGKEVILSAGALVSPLLLELSGVGNPAVLAKSGIETVVDLPTVGENLQDQMNNALSYTTNTTVDGKLAYVAYPSAANIYGNTTAEISAQVKAALPAYAAQVASANGNVTSASDLLEFFEAQHSLIFDAQVPAAEVLVNAATGAWDSEYWTLLPFSRGSVHIGDGANTTAGALINPNYFMLDWDMASQIQVARFIRSLYGEAPFAAQNEGEATPGLTTVADDADDAAWAPWIRDNYRSNFHPVGTASMLPREKGGVVDPTSLRVYGTANVRVVDASVLPFQVCGHLVSTLYAVAERAAEFIKSA